MMARCHTRCAPTLGKCLALNKETSKGLALDYDFSFNLKNCAIIIIYLLIAILYPGVVFYDHLLGACHKLKSYHDKDPKIGCSAKNDQFELAVCCSGDRTCKARGGVINGLEKIEEK